MAESIIQGVIDYVTTCPLLKEGYIRVSNLGPNPVEYGIETVPSNPIVEEYVDGSSVRQYLFAINSREYYSIDMLQNIVNSEFYEKLGDWFEEQDAHENFPDIGENKTVQKIELVTYGYLFATDRKTARYQLQLRIEYFQPSK